MIFLSTSTSLHWCPQKNGKKNEQQRSMYRTEIICWAAWTSWWETHRTLRGKIRKMARIGDRNIDFLGAFPKMAYPEIIQFFRWIFHMKFTLQRAELRVLAWRHGDLHVEFTCHKSRLSSLPAFPIAPHLPHWPFLRLTQLLSSQNERLHHWRNPGVAVQWSTWCSMCQVSMCFFPSVMGYP